MKKTWIMMVMCLLLLMTMSACGEENGPDSLLNTGSSGTEQSVSGSQNTSEKSQTKEESSTSGSSSSSKSSGSSSSAKGALTEKKALSLVCEQAEVDYSGDSMSVDESSGEILDQNDTAYIVGFEICIKGHEENNFTEAYWINKKTKEIRDVCGINEYYEGMIDITNGTALF